ncbi:MAG: copper-binding protein [Myxococcota bacterium]
MKHLVLALALCGSAFGCSGEEAAPAAAEGVYSTTGEIRQLGDDGRVDIAHEEIPDFMPAMTMPFFGEASQLEGLSNGDRVSFSFRVDEGRHVITTIQKQ